MKAIKYLLPVVLIVTLYSCENNVPTIYTESSENFVRFHLQVDSNNDVVDNSTLRNNETAVTYYQKDNYEALKIPVALTASIDENIRVNFSLEISNLNNVSIFPTNSIEFTPTKLIDTIYVDFSERWNVDANPQIDFVLTDVSDTNIHIGFPNELNANDQLTIGFEKVETSYGFSSSLIEVTGNLQEQVIIDINFENGFLVSEIENIDLLIEDFGNIAYSLEKLPIQDDHKISYLFTLEEDITESLQQLEVVFNLSVIDNYELTGSNEFTIRKSVTNTSDNAVFTASNFYNLSDPFYRTYGENWLYDTADEQCEWRSFFAFTTPVIVSESHPNAVLYSDQGTVDTSDDIYHHAFRIGFTSPTTVTTNPFNLKRWVNNYATSIVNSPGFEIEEALEFFPDSNGTSETSGIVEVIKQDLLITNTQGEPYIISISGSGTYKLLDTGVFEIDLIFNGENEALFGGVQTSYYKIYNSNIYPEPIDIPDTNNCIISVDL